MHTFDEIGTAHKVETWLDAALANKRKIMGFGHRVYKNGDSRVPTMKAALDTLVAEYNRPDLAQLYDALEAAMTERKGIRPNLGYPSGPAYSLIGFDTKLFTPHVRHGKDYRMDRAHHGAARVQRADPTTLFLQRASRTPFAGGLLAVGAIVGSPISAWLPHPTQP